jgi:hypothetical protein
VRGAEEGPAIFQAGEVQIALEVQDDADRPGLQVLLGLVTGAEAAGWTVSLWRDEQLVAETEVDDLGNLFFGGLEQGSYELIVSGPEAEIHIQNLDIGMKTDTT